MKLLIAGSRSIDDFDLTEYVPSGTTLIISGGAAGIDSVAEKYADSRKLSKLILRPRYDLYGKAAPIQRNEAMVNLADAVLIVWDGVSRGARYTAEYAQKKGKAITVIELHKRNV